MEEAGTVGRLVSARHAGPRSTKPVHLNALLRPTCTRRAAAVCPPGLDGGILPHRPRGQHPMQFKFNRKLSSPTTSGDFEFRIVSRPVGDKAVEPVLVACGCEGCAPVPRVRLPERVCRFPLSPVAHGIVTRPLPPLQPRHRRRDLHVCRRPPQAALTLGCALYRRLSSSNFSKVLTSQCQLWK